MTVTGLDRPVLATTGHFRPAARDLARSCQRGIWQCLRGFSPRPAFSRGCPCAGDLGSGRVAPRERATGRTAGRIPAASTIVDGLPRRPRARGAEAAPLDHPPAGVGRPAAGRLRRGVALEVGPRHERGPAGRGDAPDVVVLRRHVRRQRSLTHAPICRPEPATSTDVDAARICTRSRRRQQTLTGLTPAPAAIQDDRPTPPLRCSAAIPNPLG